MAKLTSIDSGTILDGVLPTPKIREIKISYSDFPPKETNPHIDHRRETIIYDTRAGAQAFKAPGFTVKKDPRNLSIEVSVVLVDRITDNKQSSWVLQEDLLKYMHLQVIHSEDKEFSDMLKTRSCSPIPSEVRKKMKNDGSVRVEIRPLSGVEALEGFYADNTPEPGLKELVLKFQFGTGTTSPEHLTYFANVYMDVEQLINDYSLNLSKEMMFSSCGDTTVEAVYRSGVQVDTANVYYYNNNASSTDPTPYMGKVYQVDSNTYIPGTELNDDIIRRDLVQIMARDYGSTPGTTAHKYMKQIVNLAREDSLNETKLQQIKKTLAGMKKRSGHTQSTALYDMLNNYYKSYIKIIDNSTKLVSKKIANETINDVRTIDELSKIDPQMPEEEEVEQLVIDIRSKDRNYTADHAARNYENARYFSNCMITRDTTAAARLAFLMDWERLATENSAYRRMIKDADLELRSLMLSKIQLQSIRLIREREDDKNVLKQFDLHMTRDREALVEVISDATRQTNSDKLSGRRTATNRITSQRVFIGSLRESELSGVTTKSIRAFEALDNSIRSRRAGQFKYRIEVSFVDRIGNFLHAKVMELRRAKDELMKYYNICSLPCNFDIANEKFTTFFTDALYATYNINSVMTDDLSDEDMNIMLNSNSPIRAPWITPVAKYTELLRIFKSLSQSQMNTLAIKLAQQLEPSTATIDSIAQVIERFDNLEESILDVLRVTVSGNETSGYSFRNSKIRSKLARTHNVVYQFPDVYDNKTLPNVGARYVYYSKEDPTGLAMITKQDFVKRMAKEERRFFTSNAVPAKNPMDDLASYRYSYMAPAHIRVGAKKLPLLDRGEALYTTEQYKEMMFSISLLKTNPAARSMTMPILSWPLGPTEQSSDTDETTAKLNMGAVSLLANYGIALAPESPYMYKRETKDEPLIEISEVLGENTLLAIKNETYLQGEQESSKENVTELANKQLSIADMSAFASSLVSTLASTGLQNFLGVPNAKLQVADIDAESLEKMRFSKTIEFFDISNPYNGIDLQTSTTTGMQSDAKIRQIPNQIKSLFLSKTGKIAPAKNWHAAEIDPIASPDTRPLFELLYFNLQKVEVMTGFQVTSQGRPVLRAPVWELLTPKHLERGGKIVCRMVRYRNDSLQIGQNTLLDLPVYNQFFTINLDTKAAVSSNPIVKAGLYTSGGEYQLTDGTNYIGEYHIHKDGLVMTGPTMGSNESRLLPNTNTTTQANAHAATLVDKLAESATKISVFEKSVMAKLITTSYEKPNIKSDYYMTEQTIPASSAGRKNSSSGEQF